MNTLMHSFIVSMEIRLMHPTTLMQMMECVDGTAPVNVDTVRMNWFLIVIGWNLFYCWHFLRFCFEVVCGGNMLGGGTVVRDFDGLYFDQRWSIQSDIFFSGSGNSVGSFFLFGRWLDFDGVLLDEMEALFFLLFFDSRFNALDIANKSCKFLMQVEHFDVEEGPDDGFQFLGLVYFDEGVDGFLRHDETVIGVDGEILGICLIWEQEELFQNLETKSLPPGENKLKQVSKELLFEVRIPPLQLLVLSFLVSDGWEQELV